MTSNDKRIAENKAVDQKAVAEEFDTYRNTYSDAVNDALIVPGMDVDYFTRVKAGYVIDLIKRHFDTISNLNVIDLGCGVGNYHDLLSPAFGSLSGIDVSGESVEQARIDHPDVDYHVYDGTVLPFEDETFDVAFAICVVHHVPVPQWPTFFAQMMRVLKPGGLGLILEHNPKNPLTMRVVNNCPFDRDAVLLPMGKTVSLMEGAGFSDVDQRSIISMPSFGPVTRKIDMALGRLPFGAQYVVQGTRTDHG